MPKEKNFLTGDGHKQKIEYGRLLQNPMQIKKSDIYNVFTLTEAVMNS